MKKNAKIPGIFVVLNCCFHQNFPEFYAKNTKAAKEHDDKGLTSLSNLTTTDVVLKPMPDIPDKQSCNSCMRCDPNNLEHERLAPIVSHN